MADYKIVATIVAQDATASGAGSAKRRLKEVEDEAKRVSGSIAGQLARAFALLGGATGIGMATKAIIGLNSEIETAQYGLATLFNVFTGTPMERSFAVAKHELAGLREDARKGVGELSDYLDGYQRILPQGFQAGASLEQMRQLNRQVLAAGAAIQGEIGLKLAPLDIAQALTGGARDRATPIVVAALAGVGKTAEEFNAIGSKADQFKVLLEAFAKFQPAIDFLSKSWSVQSTTFKDNIKEALRGATNPLFERWVEHLRDANSWLEKSRDTLAGITRDFSYDLLGSWNVLIEKVGTYAAILAGLSAAPTLGAAVGLGGAPGALAGAAAGVGVAARAFVHDPLGMVAFMGGGAAPGIGAAFANLAGVLGRLVAPVGLAVTLFLGLQGAMAEYPELLAWVMGRVAALGETLGDLANSFGLATREASVLNVAGGALLGIFGLITGAIDLAVRGIATLVAALGWLVSALGESLKFIYQYATFDHEGAKATYDALWDTHYALADQLAEIWNLNDEVYLSKYGTKRRQAPELNALDKLLNGKDKKLKVEIELKTDFNPDPARVASSFGEGLAKMVVFRTQARRVGP